MKWRNEELSNNEKIRLVFISLKKREKKKF